MFIKNLYLILELISKATIMSKMVVFMIAFLSANYAVAQEDLQVLQPSSPSTTEPGMSINNSLASNTTRTTMDSSG